VFCAAYQRRYLQGDAWKYEYVIDPAVKRLVDSGTDPEDIEDAYTLAEDPMRRITFQVWVQKYVDQGISSTLNLPAWGTKHNNEGVMEKFGSELIHALPRLRGLTCYPDGARGGQPLVPVEYDYAIQHEGEVFEETVSVCDITGTGSCGD
jgi:ribonucleoside-diphosphate reductase alpha chain